MKNFVILFVLMCLLSSCAGVETKVYKNLDVYLADKQCTEALEYLAKNEQRYGANQQLLYRLDVAMVYMQCGKYSESNNFFHSAETLSEDLYTKSISKEAASFIINDYTVPYNGEDFERAIINMFSAINYLMLDKRDDALVECRRLDSLLSLYNEKYDNNKNIYREDAFGRYLSAMIYEAGGKFDDAYIDYNKALSTFKDYNNHYETPIPLALIEDILRLSSQTGKTNEFEALKNKYPTVEFIDFKEAKNLAKIVFINFNGQAPQKTSSSIYVPSPSGPITLSFPSYLANPPSCQETTFFVDIGNKYLGSKAELVEDINQIAMKNLEDRKSRIIAKGLTRAVVKQLGLHAATSTIKDKNVKQLTRIMGNIINTQIEKADTRSWRTLPGEVSMARIFVTGGKYKLFVQQCKGGKKFIQNIEIKNGDTKFVLYDSIY